jgi:Na+/proline symporter
LACGESSIYELSSESSVFTLVTLVVPLSLGMAWKGASNLGALFAMAFGIGMWWAHDYILGEDFILPSLMTGLGASFVGLFVGSLFFPRSWEQAIEKASQEELEKELKNQQESDVSENSKENIPDKNESQTGHWPSEGFPKQ